MDKTIRTHFDKIRSEDPQAQNKAYYALIEKTDKPVDWAYEVWDELFADLKHKDNHVRAISSQVLANLAKSDPQEKMLKDFSQLLDVTKDEKFVTARHCLQSLWKVGVAGKKQQKVYMEGLEKRFKECVKEKNASLIRYDILVSMKNVYNEVKDETIKEKALASIETEKDLKYQKKYKTVWKE
ncbi:MAG: hypothetical protein JNK81_16320 [Anaerolineales bacterium]|nr:hypothetical protein [Anaerolineales bacterium]